MKAIILAAGIGSRLGGSLPKSLSRLPNGESILGRQIRIYRECGLAEILLVVGFKKELIMEEFPDVLYQYNPVYYRTNTAKSLLAAISHLDDDIVWSNGDVVFDAGIILDVSKSRHNTVVANKAKCGEEEVKYATDKHNNITGISKQVSNARGEAVGINMVKRNELKKFRDALGRCGDHDYFEKGIELLVQEGSIFRPLDVGDRRCIEVDFKEDWNKAKKMFKERAGARQ